MKKQMATDQRGETCLQAADSGSEQWARAAKSAEMAIWELEMGDRGTRSIHSSIVIDLDTAASMSHDATATTPHRDTQFLSAPPLLLLHLLLQHLSNGPKRAIGCQWPVVSPSRPLFVLNHDDTNVPRASSPARQTGG